MFAIPMQMMYSSSPPMISAKGQHRDIEEEDGRKKDEED